MAQGIAHKPTKELRDKVTDLSANGITHEEIASVLEINANCLTKHYAKELKSSRIERVSKVGTNLFKTAMAGDVTAMIFFLKTQGRWRTEDHKVNQENNEEVIKEMRTLRAELDAKNRKEY